jgi:hypothetical protein
MTRYDRIMRPARLAMALLSAVVGVVWLGQGVGLIGGSFMTGSPVWAVTGACLVGLAIVIVVVERRRGA